MNEDLLLKPCCPRCRKTRAARLARFRRGGGGLVLYVGAGTCGRANRAPQVITRINEYIEHGLLPVRVVETGCVGFCQREVFVDLVTAEGVRLSYGDLGPETVGEFLDAVFARGDLHIRFLLGKYDDPDGMYPDVPLLRDTPFFPRQTRVVLEGCGVVDPAGLDAALAAGAFRAAAAALTGMTPEEVCDEVTASCRLCVVEVEGAPRLLTSCTLEAQAGMVVRAHTPRVLKARRAILELLVAAHPPDGLSCVREGICELAAPAGDLGVRRRRFVGAVKEHPLDSSSPALARYPSKCVLRRRCVTMCHEVQGVGAIDFSGRGFATRVALGFDLGLNVSECLSCGHCARVCPTGALVERDQVDEVVAALADPHTVVVAQVARAVPATLLAGHSRSRGVRTALERLAAALKRIGFDAVFDTSFAVDLTVLEETTELPDRLRNGGPLPLFTGCSPAWVRWAETRHPELIPHLSTCKSPQQMAGALIRELYPAFAGLEDRRLMVVSLMPCTAKKAEADESRDVDIVLTTRELGHLWRRFGVDFTRLTERAPLDAPFAAASGAGRLFAASGGVMEAALRSAAEPAGAAGDPGDPKVAEARGREGMRRFSVTAGGARLELAVVDGLGNLKKSLEQVMDPAGGLRVVEVMSCPGGCVGGGGQPNGTDAAAVHRRVERLYDVDRRSQTRRAHENVELRALYEDLLGRPLGEASHRLLHRTHTDRSRSAASV